MRKQQAVWKLISNSIALDIPVMLLYVLKSSGSSPGRQGFCMAINGDGTMKGSIGGGIMEHKFVEMAKEKLTQNEWFMTIKEQIHNKSAAKNQSGMICSGEQTVLLYQVQQAEKAMIDNLINSLEAHKNGRLTISPQGLNFIETAAETDFYFKMNTETDWLYEEKTGYKNHLFIIGGGHCSLALSRLMSTMDFYIHIYDDRSALNTLAENDFVHQKTFVKDYSELSELITQGESHYAIIMTFGYRTDDIAFKAIMSKNFKYLGLLGSKKKIEKLFSTYVEEAIAEACLKNVHSPAGIQIKSQTPEEIAVSIAAEIIKVKNAHLN